MVSKSIFLFKIPHNCYLLKLNENPCYIYNNHKILEIANKRIFQYQNLYFDTDDYFFYRQHHNKKLNRYKIRYRKYIETNQCYFEIKFKNNLKKTIKDRLLLEEKNINYELTERAKKFAGKCILKEQQYLIEKIRPKLWIEFFRITFANQGSGERLTFDFNLTYSDKISYLETINNLVIVEHKSERSSLNSLFSQYLKSLKILPATFSKYCAGIAVKEKNIKQNRFKKNLIKLKELI